jgi:hypothetical protein
MRVTRVPNSDRRSATEAPGHGENEVRMPKSEVNREQWFTTTDMSVQIAESAPAPCDRLRQPNSWALVAQGSSVFD